MSSVSQEVERIKRQAAELMADRVWQVRSSEIMREGAPLFFTKLGKRIAHLASEVNSDLSLTSHSALAVVAQEHNIQIRKNATPSLKIEIYWYTGSREVCIETVSSRSLYSEPEETKTKAYFSVKNDGEVYLDDLNYLAFAEQMLLAAISLF